MANTPNILIACLFGIAVLIAALSAAFCAHRHHYRKKFFAFEHDNPSRLEMGESNDAPPILPQIEQHPPVYCVEDLQQPPPAYQAIFSRATRPSPQEVGALRRRLEKLMRRRNTPNLDNRERAIRDSEISNLSEWIQRIEALRDCEGGHIRRRPTLRLVGGGSEHQPRNSEPDRVLYREAGWVGVGLPREVRPPLDENGDLVYTDPEERQFEQVASRDFARLQLSNRQ